MSPLHSTCFSEEAVRPRSRSRSAGAVTKPVVQFFGKALPQPKDWVLTRVGTRFWRDAVPALVTKVSIGLKSEDCSLGLVLPNRFALQYGFGSTRRFLELSEVPIREVRPYTGRDHMQLHAVLLKAIKDSYTQKNTVGDVCNTLSVTEDQDSNLSNHVQETSGIETPNGGAADCPDMQNDDDDILDDKEPSSPSGEQADDESTDSEPGMQHLDSSAPDTPKQLPIARPLMRKESTEKDPNTLNKTLGTPASVLGKLEPAASDKPALGNSMTRFRELTAAVAKAFRGADLSAQLTRQELATAIGSTFSKEELQQGLLRLDKENKIFMTGDLVFLI